MRSYGGGNPLRLHPEGLVGWRLYGFASCRPIDWLPSSYVLGDTILALTSRWRRLYGLSFFLYAMHVILASITYKITSRIMSPVMYESVGYLIKISVGALGSIAIGMALGRFAPRVLKTLCGGRA